jgi:hypothetical protein
MQALRTRVQGETIPWFFFLSFTLLRVGGIVLAMYYHDNQTAINFVALGYLVWVAVDVVFFWCFYEGVKTIVIAAKATGTVTTQKTDGPKPFYPWYYQGCMDHFRFVPVRLPLFCAYSFLAVFKNNEAGYSMLLTGPLWAELFVAVAYFGFRLWVRNESRPPPVVAPAASASAPAATAASNGDQASSNPSRFDEEADDKSLGFEDDETYGNTRSYGKVPSLNLSVSGIRAL